MSLQAADIRVDLSGARSRAVTPEHGVTPADLKRVAPLIEKGHARLKSLRAKREIGFFDLHKDRSSVNAIAAMAKSFRRRKIDNLIVLGIGGSALGTATLVTALKPPYYNHLSQADRNGFPRIFVADNIDPDTFSALLALCPPDNTVFNIVSKSGGTAETVAQTLIVLDSLEHELGAARLRDYVVVTTGPLAAGGKPTPLQHAVNKYRLPSLDVPENVGGRFSVFSAVGLFPAAMLGIDVRKLLEGCARMDQRCRSPLLKENPAYQRAAIHYIAARKKAKSIAVMLPYSDKLRDVADWYRQLWAESIGKRRKTNGNLEHVGQTPVRALGATDQHSQLQLYLEGPNDKIITVIEETRFRETLPIPSALGTAGTPKYLVDRTMNQLIAAERHATIDALRNMDRPVIQIRVPVVTEFTMGQLLYMLEVETAMAGELFGINAFDQPGVEQIKVLTREYLQEQETR